MLCYVIVQLDVLAVNGRRPDLPLLDDALKILDRLSSALDGVLEISDDLLTNLVSSGCIDQQHKDIIGKNLTNGPLKISLLIAVLRVRGVESFRKFVRALIDLNHSTVDKILCDNKG